MYRLNWGRLALLVFFLGLLPLSAARAVSDEVAVQLLERLSELEQEVSNLRGENEMLRRELGNVRSAQREGFLDVDKRVSHLEKNRQSNTQTTATTNNNNAQNSITAAAAMPTPGTIVARPGSVTVTPGAPEIEVSANANNGQSNQNAPRLSSENVATQRRALTPASAGQANSTNLDNAEKVDPASPESYYYYGTQDQNKPSASNSTDTTTANTSVEQLNNIPAAHKAKAAYNQAYKLLVNNPASAVPAFRDFMTNYPEHELVANAQYWLGEALYAQKDYSGATEEFMQVLKNHKSSPKAPGAALKLGYSFYELRQWDFARRTLEDTVRFFPDTNAARLAATRLERMTAEDR